MFEYLDIANIKVSCAVSSGWNHNIYFHGSLVTNSIKKKTWSNIKIFWKPKSGRNETTHFYARKKPEAGSNYICCSVILIYYVLDKDKNYYLQVPLKEYKYFEKEKKQ